MSEFVKPESTRERLFRPELGELMFQDQFENGQLVEQRLICFSEVNGVTNKGKVESIARAQYNEKGIFIKPFFDHQSVDLKNNCLVDDRVLRYRPATVFELKSFMEKMVDYMLEEVEIETKTGMSPVLVESLAEIPSLVNLTSSARRYLGKNLLRYHLWQNISEEEKNDRIEEEAAWNLLRWLNQVDLVGGILPDEFEKIEKSLEIARTKKERYWMWLADI